jgi:hypothetical protein
MISKEEASTHHIEDHPMHSACHYMPRSQDYLECDVHAVHKPTSHPPQKYSAPTALQIPTTVREHTQKSLPSAAPHRKHRNTAPWRLSNCPHRLPGGDTPRVLYRPYRYSVSASGAEYLVSAADVEDPNCGFVHLGRRRGCRVGRDRSGPWLSALPLTRRTDMWARLTVMSYNSCSLVHHTAYIKLYPSPMTRTVL